MPRSAGPVLPPEGTGLTPPSLCRPRWTRRSPSQCPTSSISCPTLAGQCPPVTQARVSAGSWEGVGEGGLCIPEGPRCPHPGCPARGPASLLLPCGTLPCPHHGEGALWRPSLPVCPPPHLLSTTYPPPKSPPAKGWVGVCSPSFTGLFPELFISHGLCPSGHVSLFNFSSFSPRTPPSLLPSLPLLSSHPRSCSFSFLPPPPADLLEI